MRVTLKLLKSTAEVMNTQMEDEYKVEHYQALGNRKNYYYITVLYKNGEVIKELESKREMWDYMRELRDKELEEKAVKEIAQDTKIGDNEKIEIIAQQGTTITTAVRTIYVHELDNLKELEGTIVKGLGHHWEDVNDKNYGHNGGYDSDGLSGVKVIVRADMVQGYKIPYFTDLWALENDISDEEYQQILAEYQPLYDIVGTDEDSFYECEILVSNDTEFYVDSVQAPDEELDYWELEVTRVIQI